EKGNREYMKVFFFITINRRLVCLVFELLLEFEKLFHICLGRSQICAGSNFLCNKRGYTNEHIDDLRIDFPRIKINPFDKRFAVYLQWIYFILHWRHLIICSRQNRPITILRHWYML